MRLHLNTGVNHQVFSTFVTVKNIARVVRRGENVSRHTVCRSRVPTQNRIGHARGCSLYFLEMIGARTAQYAAVVHGGEQIGRHVNR